MSSMLAGWIRASLAIAALALFAGALRFQRAQNSARGLGGRISRPKVAWLFFAVFAWFIVAPLLALEPSIAPPLRWVLGGFAGSMWLRGVVEIYLLYVAKRWRPPIGIAHDASSILLLGVGVLWAVPRVQPLARPDAWAVGYAGFLVATLVVEILYAGIFFRAVAGRTTGDDGVWFADDDPRFDRINRTTRIGNAVLFGAMAIFVWVWFVGP
jgi:hypothetical protein